MAKEHKDSFLTLTELCDRGWTRATIRDLLGTEDLRRRNPWYHAAAPVRLWAVERILAAESTSEFAKRKAATERRRSSARVAARRRASRLNDWAETVPILVDAMPIDTAQARAIESYNEANYWREPAGPWCDQAFLARITVNFLRHTSTPYDDEMTRCRGKPGVVLAQSTLRARVLKAIGQMFPELAGECERQRRRPN